MDLQIVKCFLFWNLIINVGILFYWFGMIAFAQDFVYRLHGKWFKDLSKSQFQGIHYAGMAFYKMLVIVLIVVPYISLHLAT
jgi:hypothetical protein